MSCIYCHSALTIKTRNRNYCYECSAIYNYISSDGTSPKTIPTDQFGSVWISSKLNIEYGFHINIWNARAPHTALYKGDTNIISVHKLYFITPNNVDQYITKFKKLVSIS